MAGRPKTINFHKLGFSVTKINNRPVAICDKCGKSLKNTSNVRLIAHRKICGELCNVEQSDIAFYTLDEVEVENVDTVQVSSLEFTGTPVIPTISTESQKSTSSSLLSDATSTTSGSILRYLTPTCDTPSSSGTSSRPCISTIGQIASSSGSLSSNRSSTATSSAATSSTVISGKRRSMSTFVDVLTPRDKSDITTAIGNFFYGCNIPLRVIESSHFKNLVNKLLPSYAKSIPNRRALSTSILEDTYKRCLLNAKETLPAHSVLLIDGWKNSSSNSKTVVSMVHNSDGSTALINAWDLSGESETADKLTEIVVESAEIAKELYNTEIYAVVSDNAATMVKMGKNLNHYIWHSTCHSHIGNLLIKDIIDLALTENVNTVLKEFKNTDFEKQIVNKGGSKMKLACDTRWCSYRNAYQNIISNLQYMKEVIISEQPRKIKLNVSKLIFDDHFIEQIKTDILVLDPICELINFCQKSDASLADAVNMWLSLNMESINHNRSLKHRLDMALNVYALTAYYLHPKYANNKLDTQRMSQVNNFLLKNLCGIGLEELDQFKTKSGVFHILFQKDIKKPATFWRTAETYYPELSKLALRVMNLPASSAQIERMFSNWGVIHTPLRNRLTFDRSKKLLHIYFSLNNKQVINYSLDSDDD